MKFKRQYTLTLTIEAKNARIADKVAQKPCKDFRGYELWGAGENGYYEIKVHSITPKSINPKRLVW